MQLSAPIYVLKRKAKLYAREHNIALNKALDSIAIAEGFQSWSHLVSSSARESPVPGILSQLEPGDLALIGARPGHGKTLLGLELVAKASQLRRTGYFFTLDYHARDIADLCATMGFDVRALGKTVVVDTSDDVSAHYVISRLRAEARPALIVIDYLQLLDQKRTNPSLDDQIKSLQQHAHDTGAICVLISQIDRAFDLANRSMPDISDVRLPNPLDLSVFRKRIFLHDGKIQIDQAA